MSEKPTDSDLELVPTIRPFETLEVGEVHRQGLFGYQEIQRRSPRTGQAGTYQVLHIDDWVNVIALTPDDRVVLIEQYRHGIDALTWEIPGGAVDPGEDPALAAARELEEETGYVGETPELLGWVRPNPAIQTNGCGTWLIRQARQDSKPNFDEGEDIAVTTVPRSQLNHLLKTGQIDHSLVVAAFHWLALAGLDDR